MKERTSNQATPYLAVIYGAIHAVIDAVCAVVVVSARRVHGLPLSRGFWLVLGYNLLAFGGQAPFGWATDRLRNPRVAAVSGILCTSFALIFLRVEPHLAVFFAALGNALFHVGPGVVTLYTRPGRATDPGIFVAPGALGLALGMGLGRSGDISSWPWGIALAISLAVALRVRHPAMPYDGVGSGDGAAVARTLSVGVAPGAGALAVTLLLLSVAVRAMVGMAACHACPRISLVTRGGPLVAFSGKALGGVIADRLGWIETSVGALLLSAPLIAFSGGNPMVALLGLLLFQMTMPVTLVAVAKVLPRRPGLAFGLCCLALIFGSLPSFFPMLKGFYQPGLFLGLILAATVAVFWGLRLLGPALPRVR